MRIISFSDLYKTEFYLTEPFALTQNWFVLGNRYSCIGAPKPSHTFLWLKNSEAQVTDKEGHSLKAERGSLIYMSKGLEYTVDFQNTAPCQTDSVVFHFQIYDLQHNEFGFSDRPIVCLTQVDLATAVDMDLLASEFEKNVFCMPGVLSLFYRLISRISTAEHREISVNKYNYIRKGIEILESDNDNLPINEIAGLCGISECYFRKLFREYSGENPSDFRQNRRIERAKQLLLSDMLTVSQIAEKLHYVDIYHFSKVFKRAVGVSPRQFIKSASSKSKI